MTILFKLNGSSKPAKTFVYANCSSNAAIRQASGKLGRKPLNLQTATEHDRFRCEHFCTIGINQDIPVTIKLLQNVMMGIRTVIPPAKLVPS
jgi:hypothetical protein